MRPRDMEEHLSFAPSHKLATPRPLAASSAWNGAVVDYCYARLPPPGTGTGPGTGRSAMAVEASYFYHTCVSDHLPLVVDFAVKVR